VEAVPTAGVTTFFAVHYQDSTSPPSL
jgi:hypothetical protein